MGEPYFVVRIEPDTRRVVIGRREETGSLALTARDCNWLTPVPEGKPIRCLAKFRYNTPPTSATAELLPENGLRVEFDEPCYGVAPGQAVVCFDGDRVADYVVNEIIGRKLK